MGNSQCSADAVLIGPGPALNWKPRAKQLPSSRGMKDVHCLPSAHSLSESSSTIRISTSVSVVVHSTFLFPLIREGTSACCRLNTIVRWLKLDGEISFLATKNELIASGTAAAQRNPWTEQKIVVCVFHRAGMKSKPSALPGSNLAGCAGWAMSVGWKARITTCFRFL